MPVRTDLWELPRDDGQRFMLGLRRALTRRCPYCGSPGIYSGYLSLRERCPTCGVVFEREEGYFLGAYAINMIVAEFLALGLALLLILKTELRNADVLWQVVVAALLATLIPILFFPYSRGAWMALDLTLHPPRGAIERQLLGNLGRWEQDHPR